MSATSSVDRWFDITSRGSTSGREFRGGLVTFFAMAYIIALNPLIIGTAPDKYGNLISGKPYLDAAGQVIGANVGESISMVAATTALVAGVMTILMGVVGRFPIGIAAGLGLNALLAYVLAPMMTWPQAMGMVVWEGLVILVLVFTGFRSAVFKVVPQQLRSAIAVGIGLFITFVGLINAGVVRKPAGAPPVEFGIHGSLAGWPIAVFVVGLLLVIVLSVRKVRGALLISIIATTICAVVVESLTHAGRQAPGGQNPTGWALNVPSFESLFAWPDLSLVGRVDMFGAFADAGTVGSVGLIMLVFALLLADFFDTMGTVVAVGTEGDILDDAGNPPHLGAILAVDSISAMAGGLGSVSSNTAYVESASGVGEGARTGLASVFTGIGFLLAVFLSPVVGMVPSEAVAPTLVFVGFLMMTQVTDISWGDIEHALPAFVTIVMMPFAYSITVGIGAGFILFVVLKVALGKIKQVHPLMWVVSMMFVIYFLQGPLQALLGAG